MIVKKTYSYLSCGNTVIPLRKGLLDIYIPPTVESTDYKNLFATLDLRTCEDCASAHGQIFPMDESVMVPLHDNCRCIIIPI